MENKNLIDKVNKEIKDIETEISTLDKELHNKEKYLESLKNDNYINKILSDSTKEHTEFNIKILTNCKYNDNTPNPWSNIIITTKGRNMVSKHTIDYPESYNFNSELKELILKYINCGVSIKDVSIVEENVKLCETIEKLNEENRKLKNSNMWHVEYFKMFNALSWWKKMRFKFNIASNDKITH